MDPDGSDSKGEHTSTTTNKIIGKTDGNLGRKTRTSGKADNLLHLKILHIFHNDETPDSVSIIVYSVNDELKKGASKYECFVLHYEYAQDEVHFTTNDISRTLLLSNFKLISTPAGVVECQGTFNH